MSTVTIKDEPVYVLELSLNEVRVLRTLIGCVAGGPNTWERYITQLWEQLRDVDQFPIDGSTGRSIMATRVGDA